MDSGRLRGAIDDQGVVFSPSGPPQPPRDSVELQKLLIDAQLRCEDHKTNYQIIKEEHRRLQDEHIQLQQQLSTAKNNGIQTSDQMQSLSHELKNQLALKSKELEELRSEAMNPHNLEVIRAQITKELEEPVKAHMMAMDKEVEKYRTEYNKLRYELTFVKSEFSHAKSEHLRNVQEQNLRHKAEVSILQQERENLLKNQSPADVDAQKLVHLQRQKNQLDQRVKNLLDELAELRKQREHSMLEADSIQRTQAKDLTLLHSKLKEIESDKRSSEMQKERLQKELRDCSDQNTRLTQQIQSINKECTSLKNIVDEENHKHKVELTNQKMELLKIKGGLERERDSMTNKFHTLESELDIARSSMERHKRQVEEMEGECSRRVQDAREEEWVKNNSMQNEKIEFEEKCRELEQRLSAEKSSRSSEHEQNENKTREMEMNEMELKSEISNLKMKLNHESQGRQQSEKDREECVKLRQELTVRQVEGERMSSNVQQISTELERVKEALQQARSDVESARLQTQKTQNDKERSIEDQKIMWMEEKHRLQTRLDQLEYKIKKNDDLEEKNNKQQKKAKHALVQKVKQLKGRNELLEAEKEKLEIELKVGRHGVSKEDYNKMRRRMRDLKRRHEEFRHVIGQSENLSSTRNPGDMTSFNFNGINDLTNDITTGSGHELRHQREMSLIRKRLDEVSKQQKEQMEVFDAITTGKSEKEMFDNKVSYEEKSDKNSEKNSSAGGSARYENEEFELESNASSA